MIENKNAIVGQTHYTLRYDMEALKQIIAQCMTILKKQKSDFCYDQGIRGISVFNPFMEIQIERTGNGFATILFNYADLQLKMDFAKILDEGRIVPNELTNEELLIFQKYIIKLAWDKYKSIWR